MNYREEIKKAIVKRIFKVEGELKHLEALRTSILQKDEITKEKYETMMWFINGEKGSD